MAVTPDPQLIRIVLEVCVAAPDDVAVDDAAQVVARLVGEHLRRRARVRYVAALGAQRVAPEQAS
jgi:hypothetical protein